MSEPEEIPDVEDRITVERQIKLLQSFIGSELHQLFVKGKIAEQAIERGTIITIEPVGDADYAEHFKARGRLETITALTTTFEDALSNLNDQLDKMDERKKQDSDNRKK